MKKIGLSAILIVAIVLISGCTQSNPPTSEMISTDSGKSQEAGLQQKQDTCITYQEPHIVSVPYTTEEPYQENEYYTEREPYKIPKQTKWDVKWYTFTGNLEFGGEVDGDNNFTATFLYDWTGNPGGVGNTGYKEFIGFRADAEINVKVAGVYIFTIGSDDGSRLSIDGSLIIDNWRDGAYDASVKNIDVALSQGKHRLQMEYYNHWKNPKVSFKVSDSSILSWEGVGYRDVQKIRTVIKTRSVPKIREEIKNQTITKCS